MEIGNLWLPRVRRGLEFEAQFGTKALGRFPKIFSRISVKRGFNYLIC